MASTKSPRPFMALALVLTLLPSLGRVSGLDKLTGIVCHETDRPELCLQCLRSAPAAELGSKVAIARALLSCLAAHGGSLGAATWHLASGAAADKEKLLFKGCSELYSASNKDLLAAAALVDAGDYDGGEKAVTAALYRHQSCRDGVAADGRARLPEKVAYEMRVYEELCQVADRVIEKL